MPNIMKVFTGNANPEIAREICNYLDMPLSKAEVKQFSDGEISVIRVKVIQVKTFFGIEGK